MTWTNEWTTIRCINISVSDAKAQLTDLVRRAEAGARACIPAGLNFGDCFAYALAREHRCPLLYVGEDFAKTDVERARAG